MRTADVVFNTVYCNKTCSMLNRIFFPNWPFFLIKKINTIKRLSLAYQVSYFIPWNNLKFTYKSPGR